jgi:hypothetical protein
MKKILIIIFTTFLSNIIIAQTPPVIVDYDTCNYLSSFQGMWIYANGNDTIRIYLKKVRSEYIMSPTRRSISDRLLGWHEYKSGSNIIQSDFQYRNMLIPFNFILSNYDNYSIIMGFDKLQCGCGNNSRKFRGLFTDYNKASETNDINVTINPARTVMTFKQANAEWFGAWTGLTGMTLPVQFDLTKQ